MSKQWNQMCSVTKECTLSEVMSEEFSKRLKIDEDFVWVELPETVREIYGTSIMGHIEVKTEDQSPSQTNSAVTNVVQSVTQNAGLEPVEEKFSDLSDDDGDILPGNEDIIDTEYINQCVRNKVKAIHPSEIKYPTPYWMKIKERSSFKIEKRQFSKQNNDKINSKKQVSELLPKMKFDASTTAVLDMLINNGCLEQYSHLVGRGKNSVVFEVYNAHNKNNRRPRPDGMVVKIYKTSDDEEKNKLIYRKVQREFKHLSILFRKKYDAYGFPQPVGAWKNVILMGFIGYDGEAAPSIQDVPHEVDEGLYNFIVHLIDRFYSVKLMVHGNLSAANILYWFKHAYFVGWSQSVKSDHPLAMTKLIKDCHFVTEISVELFKRVMLHFLTDFKKEGSAQFVVRILLPEKDLKFYKRRGVKVMPLKDLVQKITMQEPSEKLLEAIQGTKDLYSKYDTNPNRRTCTGWVKPPSPTNNRFKK